jgi:uncharacterized protein YegL
MKNNVTELVFILDKSGSMEGFEADTVGGFNATIEKQKEENGTAYVSTVLFSNTAKVIHDRIDLHEVPKMTRREYRVGGCTALLDAVGDAIRHIEGIHKYARPEDVPAHTVFVITTDGMENASRNYSHAEIRKMIDEKTKKHGWEFVFLAANIDATEAAESIGIRPERAAGYRQTKEGIDKSYCVMSEAISAIRTCRTEKMNLSKYMEDAENEK